jgi:hypothetical protein
VAGCKATETECMYVGGESMGGWHAWAGLMVWCAARSRRSYSGARLPHRALQVHFRRVQEGREERRGDGHNKFNNIQLEGSGGHVSEGGCGDMCEALRDGGQFLALLLDAT